MAILINTSNILFIFIGIYCFKISTHKCLFCKKALEALRYTIQTNKYLPISSAHVVGELKKYRKMTCVKIVTTRTIKKHTIKKDIILSYTLKKFFIIFSISPIIINFAQQGILTTRWAKLIILTVIPLFVLIPQLM